MSPRKQSSVGELDRAPGARPSRIALRPVQFTRQPERRPAGARAAGGEE